MARWSVGQYVRLNSGRHAQITAIAHDGPAEYAVEYEIFDLSDASTRVVNGTAIEAAEAAPVLAKRSLAELTAALAERGPAAIDVVFRTFREELDKFTPTLDESRAFVAALLEAVRREDDKAAPLIVERSLALGEILHYLDNKPTSYYRHVDPATFAFQLACRVRKPSLINQQDLGLCGAVAVMIHFGKNAPQKFARYGLDLISSGRGRFFGLEISPSATVSYGQYSGTMPQADLVLVGSLGIALFDYFDKPGASAAAIAGWLDSAGYRVEEKTLEFASDASMLMNLQAAAAHVQANHLVVLAVRSKFAKAMLTSEQALAAEIAAPQLRPKIGTGPLALEARVVKNQSHITDHWVLTRRLILEGSAVRVKIYTWTAVIDRVVPLDVFLSYYGGYIAAYPPG